MRVLITVPSLAREFGGPAAKAAHLSKALREAGCETSLIGCGSAPGAIGLPTIGRLHATPIPRSIAPIKVAVAGSDVVHILGYRDPVGTAAAAYARRRGIPYIVEPLGMYGPKLRSARMKAAYESAFGKRLMARAKMLIATSEVESTDLIGAGLSATSIRLRPNGVSVGDLLPLPERGSFRARMGIGADALLVLTISRLSITKGLTALGSAAYELPEVVFVVAGPDDRDGTLAALKKAAVLPGLGARLIVLPEGLWGSDKAFAFADADCFCLPSATESFGIAAAEAAALGLPVVLSDRCGGREWLNPESTRIFEFGNTPALVEVLRETLADEPTTDAARAAAPAIRDRLKWSSVAAMQIDLYNEALAPTA